MAQAVLYSKTGSKKETPVKLSAKVFGAEVNHDLVDLAYRAYLANGRTGSAQTLSRGMVRGGGRKPWRQKGTGRARAGSTRLPHWTGGGVAFGPTGNENYRIDLPVKAKRSAIRQALSLAAKAKKVSVIEAFDGGDGKAKPTAALLDKLGLEGRVVLVVANKTEVIDRATRNLPGLTVVTATYLNVFTIVNADHVLMTSEAEQAVTKWLEGAA
ncbi:50S ribosomal protein L4 [Patescibacteria group bacterium]|nr:MAG: 50S ribosomal protein L4 [Patescibacteria group bacterium]